MSARPKGARSVRALWLAALLTFCLGGLAVTSAQADEAFCNGVTLQPNADWCWSNINHSRFRLLTVSNIAGQNPANRNVCVGNAAVRGGVEFNHMFACTSGSMATVARCTESGDGYCGGYAYLVSNGQPNAGVFSGWKYF